MNMEGSSGRPVANQFIIIKYKDDGAYYEYFQSYSAIVGERLVLLNEQGGIHKAFITLDEYFWNYSRTTSKYRNKWLGMNTQQIKQAIMSGVIKLRDLN